MLPVYDLSCDEGRGAFEGRLDRLRNTASSSTDAGRVVAEILAEVRERGDAAVVDYMRKWTDPEFTADRLVVSGAELDASLDAVDPALVAALEQSIENVRAYQEHVLPRDPEPVRVGSAELGMRWSPVDSVGLCVPGGTAVLFSTVIMLAVPALVAGVPAESIAVMNPPATRRADEPASDLAPAVLATCKLLGLSRVYRLGGAQGVAALAMGTERIEAVDLIAGPGNVFVQLAKAQVAGITGTDNGFYGPSEIVTVADETADAERVASDLIAQAEHDPGKCFLVSWSGEVIERIVRAVGEQLGTRKRREAIERSLAEESCAVLVADADEAIAVTNRLATEHLNLAVADPEGMLGRIRHAGEVFLGDTPVAAGDYYAGPSHCLPTGTTARFTSGVSAYTFLKRTGTVRYPEGVDARTAGHIALMAEAEGLDGHAQSARVRAE
ncbi:histidinol dehydrogenase [Mucisphaera calidilacus]|uniref:Histidinol dehydrogenase n=1 Tax=Mucisphaera calidilacus TaxID=2527982 RepID=A0A518BZM3_9BACT|nr:histidinol dehydrogenase [Mucisphaera calidilacus]QDU72427.1 Histidinol dehydrogenase [Mucisphaera calidilacus]